MSIYNVSNLLKIVFLLQYLFQVPLIPAVNLYWHLVSFITQRKGNSANFPPFLDLQSEVLQITKPSHLLLVSMAWALGMPWYADKDGLNAEIQYRLYGNKSDSFLCFG